MVIECEAEEFAKEMDVSHLAIEAVDRLRISTRRRDPKEFEYAFTLKEACER